MRNRNQVVMPLDLGIKIDENDPVRKLVEICDELDYADLYAAYLRHWRKIDPCTMFELLVFAYMNGIYSSRDIESACRHDIRLRDSMRTGRYRSPRPLPGRNGKRRSGSIPLRGSGFG